MKFRMLQMYVFVVLMLSPVLAFGAEEVAQQVWWQTLLAWLVTHIGELVFSVLGTAVILLLRKYLGVKLEQEQLDRVLGWAKNAAESKALGALNAGAPKTPGAEKMKMAGDIAEGLIDQFKLKKLARDKIEHLLEAKLGEEKIEEKKELLKAVTVNGVNGGSPVVPKIVVPKWAQDDEPGDG
jgi:hypothetical protein